MENKHNNVFAKSLYLIFLSPSHLLHMAMLIWKQRLLPINLFNFAVAIVQSLSLDQLFVTPWITAHQAPQSSIICWSLLKSMSIESVMLSNHVILCHPSPPAFSLSQHQGLFQWVSSSHQLAKYWSFSFSISPSNEYSGFISFRID